ncbi:MAG TPA: DinB family protein [Micromonosporaceae bacterium]|nr:DinB family protein [Micromonosporaceae bacterium]
MVELDATRVDPPQVAGEREQLEAWLDYHRATLLMKCAGLTGDQLRMRSTEPSKLSLLGLVRHMTDVENGWFSDFVGEMRSRYWTEENYDADFDDVDTADVAEAFAAYAEECDKSRAAAARNQLDDTYTDERGRTFDLRWLYLHMIEEYARHNGHADLIRERIDGAVGD